MQQVVLFHLRARRASIRSSWAALLQVEPVTTPLAEPQVLAHLFDFTLNRIFDALANSTAERAAPAIHCPCGLNPYLAYFRAAEQTLLQALVLVHAEERPKSDPAERTRDVTDLKAAVRLIGGDEIALLAGICCHSKKKESCGRCPLPPPANPPSL